MEQETCVWNQSTVSQDNPTVHINTRALYPYFRNTVKQRWHYGCFSASLDRPESLSLHWEILSASSSFLKAVYIALHDVQEKEPPLPSPHHLDGFTWASRSIKSPLLLFCDRRIPPMDCVPSPRSPSAMSSSEGWSRVLACSRSPFIISSFTWTQSHKEPFQRFFFFLKSSANLATQSSVI